MSAFICNKCDRLADADDGCEATPDGMSLICIACVNDEEDEPCQPS